MFWCVFPLLLLMTALPPGQSGDRETHRGTIVTTAGMIEFELYGTAAPLSVANFIQYAEGGFYDGSSFYRATNNQSTSHGACCINIVQGGFLGDIMRESYEEIMAITLNAPFDSIPHESTHSTGLENIQGAISFGRFAPGSATSEFFVSTQANPILDFGGKGHPDGQGYAVFGHVTSGLFILEKLQTSSMSHGPSLFKGQLLEVPLQIKTITIN